MGDSRQTAQAITYRSGMCLFAIQLAMVVGTICYIFVAAQFLKPKRTFIQPILILILALWLVAEVGFVISLTNKDSL